MSLVDQIDALLPRWMLTAPRQAFGKLMAGFAGLLDGFIKAIYEARIAAVPGQVNLPGVAQIGGFDSVDALPLIARDRAVIPGLGEMPWDTAERCRTWLDDAASQTGPFGLLDALADILVPTVPRLRLVTDNGTVTTWYTRETDGTRRQQRSDGTGFYLEPNGTSAPDTTVAHRWIWDATTVPPPGDAGDTSGFFVIIYAPACTPFFTGPQLTALDGPLAGFEYNNKNLAYDSTIQGLVVSPMAATCGTNAPWELCERIRAVIMSRRATGNVCRWIVAALDPTSFAPDGSSSSPPVGTAYPDGNWGQATKYDGVSQSRIPSRNGTAEYWAGRSGAVAP